MPNLTAPSFTIPGKSFPSAGVGVWAGIAGELLGSELLPRYSHLVKAGKVQYAYAVLAASSPVIFSTSTLTGGPFLWNPPGTGLDAHIISMSVVEATVPSTGTAGGLGLAFGPQTVTPTATTAIDNSGNCLVGGGNSAMTVYRTATPTAAATGFLPTFQVGLTAVTAQFVPAFVDIAGALIVPPGNFVAVAGSSTQTNGVFRVGLMWAELPT